MLLLLAQADMVIESAAFVHSKDRSTDSVSGHLANAFEGTSLSLCLQLCVQSYRRRM
jgi:hypothetical protein